MAGLARSYHLRSGRVRLWRDGLRRCRSLRERDVPRLSVSICAHLWLLLWQTGPKRSHKTTTPSLVNSREGVEPSFGPGACARLPPARIARRLGPWLPCHAYIRSRLPPVKNFLSHPSQVWIAREPSPHSLWGQTLRNLRNGSSSPGPTSHEPARRFGSVFLLTGATFFSADSAHQSA